MWGVGCRVLGRILIFMWMLVCTLDWTDHYAIISYRYVGWTIVSMWYMSRGQFLGTRTRMSGSRMPSVTRTKPHPLFPRTFPTQRIHHQRRRTRMMSIYPTKIWYSLKTNERRRKRDEQGAWLFMFGWVCLKSVMYVDCFSYIYMWMCVCVYVCVCVCVMSIMQVHLMVLSLVCICSVIFVLLAVDVAIANVQRCIATLYMYLSFLGYMYMCEGKGSVCKDMKRLRLSLSTWPAV